MRIFSISRRRTTTIVGAAFAVLVLADGTTQAGDRPQSQADFRLNDPGVSSFTMTGVERRFGRFSAFGEMDVRAGQGLVVLTAANGDQIVGVVGANAGDDKSVGRFQFSWRDSVAFSDGAVYTNTGRLAKQRPPGVKMLAVIPPPVGRILPYIEQDN